MRRPDDAADLTAVPGVAVLPLDVTSTESVESAVAAVVGRFGRLDAVVNNAGYAVDGVFEGADDAAIRRQFETNVFGLMRVTRAAIPVMRRQGSGTLVQVSSMGGRITFPLYSLYHATKWAVEGFSESLAFELRLAAPLFGRAPGPDAHGAAEAAAGGGVPPPHPPPLRHRPLRLHRVERRGAGKPRQKRPPGRIGRKKCDALYSAIRVGR